MAKIIVVGAGVIGLSCALVLAENGHKVRVVSSHFPTDAPTSSYTSPWAGAHFRPFPSKNETEAREAKLTRITQKYFRTLAAEEPESSIRFVPGLEFIENPDKFYTFCSPGYSEEMTGFRRLDKSELPVGADVGYSYETWVLNAPLYIQYLQRKLTMLYGVEFIRMTANSIRQVCELYPKSRIVNASGQGLQYYGGYDPKCYPIRGQTLLVRAPKDCPYLHKTVTHQNKDGLWTFVIPRPCFGGVILGGTKQLNDLQSIPREQDSLDLIERAKILYPELMIDGKFDVRSVNVGFRPARENGMRIELEKISGRTIIHAYGAGGMGYELSYGAGQKVNEILAEELSTPKL